MNAAVRAQVHGINVPMKVDAVPLANGKVEISISGLSVAPTLTLSAEDAASVAAAIRWAAEQCQRF